MSFGAPHGTLQQMQAQARATQANWEERARAVAELIRAQSHDTPEADLSFLNSPDIQQRLQQQRHTARRRKVTHRPRPTTVARPQSDAEKARGDQGDETTDQGPKVNQAKKHTPKKGGGKPAPGMPAFGPEATKGTAKQVVAEAMRRAQLEVDPKATDQAAGVTTVSNKKGGGKFDAKGAHAHADKTGGDPTKDPWVDMNAYQELVAGRSNLPPRKMQILVSSKDHNPYGQDIIMSQAELMSEFLSADEDTIRQWQQRLLAAAYYEPESKYYTRKDVADPLSGQVDKDTRKAFTNLLADAALRNGIYRYNEADRAAKKPGRLLGGVGGDLDTLLQGRTDAFAGELADLNSSNGRDGGGGGGGGAAQTYQLDDPAQLKALTNVVAQELIGKQLPDDQINQIITKIQSQELESEQVQGGVVNQVDPEARIAQMIRQFQPVESQAHDIVSMYDQFRGLLSGNAGGALATQNTKGF